MCLAIPSRIVEMDEFRATVDVCGARREINLMLMPEEVGIGDYVLVHAGFALQKIEQEAAAEALKVVAELIEAEGEDMEEEMPFGGERARKRGSSEG